MKKLLLVYLLAISAAAVSAQTSNCSEGIKLLENENYKGALEKFMLDAKNDPKNSAIYYYIGEVSYRQDNPAEAEKAYKKGLSIDPQCAECKVGLGKLALDAGKTAEANEYLESAARLAKKNAEVFAMIGDAYLKSTHPDADKAIQYLGQARDMNPKIARYWAHLGDAYRMKGDNGEAMTHYESAVEKDPNNTAAYISMARIWSGAKQYDLAIEKLNEAIKLSPDDAPPYKDLIEMYIQTGQYDKVTPLLTKYTSLTGNDVDAKVRLVKFLTFQAKDYDRAIEEGEKLLLTNPEQYTLHRWLAWSYAEKSMWQQSLDHSKKLFDEIAKDNNRKAFASDYEYWAKAALGLGDLDEAAHIYRKYLEFEPSKAYDIYTKFAKAYYDAKNYEQAIAYYKRKEELKPLSVQDLYFVAASQYARKNYPAADSAFARVLEITPEYSTAWWYRAKGADLMDTTEQKTFAAKPFYDEYIKFGTIDLEKAKSEAGKEKTVASITSNLVSAYIWLTVFYVQGNDNAKAKEMNAKALELDPANATALEHKGILESQGKGR